MTDDYFIFDPMDRLKRVEDILDGWVKISTPRKLPYLTPRRLLNMEHKMAELEDPIESRIRFRFEGRIYAQYVEEVDSLEAAIVKSGLKGKDFELLPSADVYREDLASPDKVDELISFYKLPYPQLRMHIELATRLSDPLNHLVGYRRDRSLINALILNCQQALVIDFRRQVKEIIERHLVFTEHFIFDPHNLFSVDLLHYLDSREVPC